MKVLLADDSNLILQRLQQMISWFTNVEIVKSCRNGIDTLNSLRKLKPVLAIINIAMQGLSGLEVLQEIKKENLNIKFIMLSIYLTDYYKKKVKNEGADYLFSESDDFEKISEVIEKMAKDEYFNKINI